MSKKFTPTIARLPNGKRLFTDEMKAKIVSEAAILGTALAAKKYKVNDRIVRRWRATQTQKSPSPGKHICPDDHMSSFSKKDSPTPDWRRDYRATVGELKAFLKSTVAKWPAEHQYQFMEFVNHTLWGASCSK